jgi:alkanesulfonate monooxygenase SsuD/methylene tetrahydromethanopterin reductase-like flavin-dependent oxidoreductase (luciferase family)
MNLPVMAPGLDRALVTAWCRRIDEGPWSTLAAGERITFPNPELITSMGFAAALTERVRLISNVHVLPLHRPALLAKQIATLDVLSGGRVTLGVGVGGREEDYQSLDVPFAPSKLDRVEDGVRAIRAAWAGELTHDGALRPVEPAPVQPGGPPILSGSLGPVSIARAARWADGIVGFSFTMAEEELHANAATIRKAWEEAGRDDAPRLLTGTWFALDDAPQEQLADYLMRYLNFLGPMAEHFIPTVTAVGVDGLRRAVEHAQAAGFDELLLTPTTTDPDEIARAEDALSDLF